MPILVNGHGLKKTYAGRTLFDGLSFGIDSSERIGLIGANGAGKSTLLRIIAGRTDSDGGTVSRKQGLRVAYLEQTPTLDTNETLMATIMSGAIDPHDWEAMSQAQELFSKLEFDRAGLAEDLPVGSLSGGWRKKVALARELMRHPDLLLLDEPTNHLDVESILWLEEFLDRAPFATLTITHDRLFLNRVSNRIWEMDRRNPNGLLVINGDYADYCEAKQQQVHAQERREDVLRNTLRHETAWLRKQPRARITKSQARIDATHRLAEDVADMEYINKKQNVGIAFASVDDTPKKLIDAKNITKRYGDKTLFENFSLTLQRGSRLGLLGANGSGKSTFIRAMLGLEEPDSGTVERSERLKVAYFEQSRDALDPKLTVFKTICPAGEYVKFRGNFVHARGYLDRFLFSPVQTENLVEKLSGGEQARLLIARLMLTEANLLVLDEPTNDLDLATLNVLEEQLREFDGAVILVTHDRYFLDQVSERLLAFADGEIETFTGIGQWENWRRAREANGGKPVAESRSSAPGYVPPSATPAIAEKPKKKLGYLEQREFDGMEKAIQKAEAEVERLNADASNPKNAGKLGEIGAKLTAAQAEVERLYARWSELGG